MGTISRRAFLKWAGVTGLALAGASCTTQPSSPLPMETAAPEISPSQPAAPKSDQAYLSVARGEDPAALVSAAVAALGGIERFVKPGKDVIIKPNICTDYHPPEYAATTNPQVVAALVSLCLGAGAKRVRVMDNPFGGSPASAYAISGIEAAVRAAGGEMELMSPVKYASFDIPDGRDIQSWEFYRDILETDVLINVPIAKHHGLARLTLAGKNLLGTIQSPNRIHANLGQRIADLVSRVRPTLTVIDGYRILMDHGPTGGSLDDVKLAQTVIASHDIVAADAYGATLFGLKGEDIGYIKKAAEMQLGTLDLSSVKVEEIRV